MNYLGHAWIALAHGREPAFVLGSMLPDFATMAGVRLAPQSHPEVQCGVALHHATDDAFHGHPNFTGLVDHVRVALQDRGVGRGTARAVGHIGIELLMDGELLAHTALQSAYMDALNAASALPLAFRQDDASARFQLLRRRLRDLGVPWDYQRPEGVAYRLERALASRPRLRPRPEDAQPIRQVLQAVQPDARQALSPILASVLEKCGPATRPALQ